MPRGRKKGSKNIKNRQKVGEKGGKTTLEEYGPEFYSEIGTLGDQVTDSPRNRDR